MMDSCCKAISMAVVLFFTCIVQKVLHPSNTSLVAVKLCRKKRLLTAHEFRIWSCTIGLVAVPSSWGLELSEILMLRIHVHVMELVFPHNSSSHVNSKWY